MTAVIDMRTWGRVNDPNFANTQALLSALARRDWGEPLEVFFPAGDWHFTGPLPVGTHSDLSLTTSPLAASIPRRRLNTKRPAAGGAPAS